MKTKLKKVTDEIAAQIINDIAEDIDNGESRETLRACVAYLATENANLAMKFASADSRLKMVAMAFGIIRNVFEDEKTK